MFQVSIFQILCHRKCFHIIYNSSDKKLIFSMTILSQRQFQPIVWNIHYTQHKYISQTYRLSWIMFSFFIVPVRNVYNDCNVSIIRFRIIKLFSIENMWILNAWVIQKKEPTNWKQRQKNKYLFPFFCVIYFRDFFNLNEKISSFSFRLSQ